MQNRKKNKIDDENDFGFEPIESYQPAANQEFGFEPIESYSKEQQKEEPTISKSQLKDLPWYLKAGLGALQSAQVPLKQAVPERAEAVGQGIRELAQGPMQLINGPEYTKQVEAQRKAYESTHGGQDPLSNLIREQVKETPYIAALTALGPIGVGGKIIKNMLKTGGTFAGIKGLEFTPENEDRLSRMAKAGLLGAGFELAPQALNAPQLAKDVLTGEFFTGKKKYGALEEKLMRAQKEQELKKAQAATETAQTKFEEAGLPHEEALRAKEAAEEAKERAGVGFEEAKNIATAETGGASPYGMEHKIRNNKQELTTLNQNIDALNHQMENLSKPQKLEPSDISHVKARHNAEEEFKEAQGNVEKARQYHEDAKRSVAESDINLGNYFGEHLDHEVHLARGINAKLEKSKEEIQAGYDEFTNELKEKNVQVSDPAKIEQKSNQLLEFIKNNEAHTPEALQVLQELETLKTPFVNAGDFYKSIRSAKQYARDARKKAFSIGMNEETRAMWEKNYKELDHLVDQMESAFEKSLGKEYKERAQKLSKGWRENVAVLYDNPLYWKMNKYGQLNDNVIKSLRGERNPGNELIKKIIKNDPALTKLAVGQRYVTSPNEIYKGGERISEYLNLLPEAKGIIKNREKGLEQVEKGKSNISLAENNEQLYKDRLNEAKKISEREETAAKEKGKEHAAQKEAYEKEQGRLQKEMTSHKEKIKELEKEIPKLEKNKKELIAQQKEFMTKDKELKKAAKQEKISLKQKVEAEKSVKKNQDKIDRITKEIASIDNKLKETHFGIKSLTHLGWKAAKKAFKVFY